MGRYKLDIYDNVNEPELRKINRYIKILDNNDTLEIYIHDKSNNLDMINTCILRNNLKVTISKDIDKDNKTIRYIKIIKKE